MASLVQLAITDGALAHTDFDQGPISLTYKGILDFLGRDLNIPITH